VGALKRLRASWRAGGKVVDSELEDEVGASQVEQNGHILQSVIGGSWGVSTRLGLRGGVCCTVLILFVIFIYTCTTNHIESRHKKETAPVLETVISAYLGLSRFHGTVPNVCRGGDVE